MGRTADAGPGRDQPAEARPRQLADEQAALRRVATLVAGGALPSEVFSAVADELGQLIGVEATFVCRVDLPRVGPPGAAVADPSGERAEPEGYVTVAASYGRMRDEVPVGFRVKLSPGMVMTMALRTGRPARIKVSAWRRARLARSSADWAYGPAWPRPLWPEGVTGA